MVGFGYIEVSVHHMDVRPGPPLGLPYGIKGLVSCFAAHLGAFSKQGVPRPRCDAGQIRWLSLQSGVMGIETWGFLLSQ